MHPPRLLLTCAARWTQIRVRDLIACLCEMETSEVAALNLKSTYTAIVGELNYVTTKFVSTLDRLDLMLEKCAAFREQRYAVRIAEMRKEGLVKVLTEMAYYVVGRNFVTTGATSGVPISVSVSASEEAKVVVGATVCTFFEVKIHVDTAQCNPSTTRC